VALTLHGLNAKQQFFKNKLKNNRALPLSEQDNQSATKSHWEFVKPNAKLLAIDIFLLFDAAPWKKEVLH
jgi:hypothetical protein